jgi:pilus assembly protein Flp/PilA
MAMRKALKVFNQLMEDENGAALIEYTVLLGILLIAVIATIGLVGTWVSKQWLALDKVLSP